MEIKPRRAFLGRLTGAVVGIGALVATWPLFRSLVPNVLYEPPKRFKVGSPEGFQQGVTFLESQRVFLFRSGNSFHAISGVCTHLGCTVKFAPYPRAREETVRDLTFQSLGEFHCPCHGSKFKGDGTNFDGPAPRPLKWYLVEVSPADGKLVVDLGTEVDRDYKLVVA